MIAPRSRRAFLRTSGVLIAGAGGAGLLAACAGGASSGATVSTAALTTTATAAAPAASATSVQSAPPAVTTTGSAGTGTATAAGTTASATPSVASSAAPTTTAAPATSSAAAARAAGTTLIWWGEFCGNDLSRLPALLGPFEQAHPGVKVEPSAVCEASVTELEKLTTLYAGGTPPDLLLYTGELTDLVRRNLVADLGPLVARDHFDLSQFNPALLTSAASWQGKLYGMPVGYGGNGLAMVYNRTLFKNAGIPEPPTKWGDDSWTWDAVLAIAQKLTKVNGATFQQVGWGGLGYYMDLPQLWQTSWITPDFKTIVCDSPAMVDCYTHYGDLTAKYHVAPRPGEQAPKGGFLGGTVGMATIGGWQFSDFAKAPGLDWAFAPYPKVKVSGAQASPITVQLPQGGKQQDDAWALMLYLQQGARQALWQNYVPVQSDIRANWAGVLFAGKDVRVPVLLAAIDAATPEDNILLTKSWPQMSKPVNDAMGNLSAGKANAQDTLGGLKGQLQGLLNQNG